MLIPTTVLTSSGTAGITLITDFTVTGSVAASMDFTSIPQTYKHLVVKMKTRADTAVFNQNLLLRLNNDSGANYNSTFIYTSSGAASQPVNNATSAQLNFCGGDNAIANHFNYTEITIPFYTDTTTLKSLVSNGEVVTNAYYVINGAGVWGSTAAVNRLTFLLDSGNFMVGTHVLIYGIV